MQEQGAVADRTAVCKDALGRIIVPDGLSQGCTGLELPRHPRELEPGVLCAKAFRFRMQRDAWNGSTPAMDHMMVSISPCHCPSVLSRHVPTSDCPDILGRRTRQRAVAVNTL